MRDGEGAVCRHILHLQHSSSTILCVCTGMYDTQYILSCFKPRLFIWCANKRDHSRGGHRTPNRVPAAPRSGFCQDGKRNLSVSCIASTLARLREGGRNKNDLLHVTATICQAIETAKLHTSGVRTHSNVCRREGPTMAVYGPRFKQGHVLSDIGSRLLLKGAKLTHV